MTKSTKNENRKSTIKGMLANPVKQTFEQFEIETEYTRSNVKAAELVKQAMKLDPQIMVSVFEIINTPLEAVKYDAQSLKEFASEIFADEIEAKNYAEKNNVRVIRFDQFIYSGQVWAFNGEDYVTDFHGYESTVKLGKVDTRGAIKMNYEKLHKGYKVIGIHGDKREEFRRYACITPENLEQVKTL